MKFLKNILSKNHMAALWAVFVIALSMPIGHAQLGDSEFLPPREPTRSGSIF
jgi:hypothetical protein